MFLKNMGKFYIKWRGANSVKFVRIQFIINNEFHKKIFVHFEKKIKLNLKYFKKIFANKLYSVNISLYEPLQIEEYYFLTKDF